MLLLDIEMLCCCFHYPLMEIMQHSKPMKKYITCKCARIRGGGSISYPVFRPKTFRFHQNELNFIL